MSELDGAKIAADPIGTIDTFQAQVRDMARERDQLRERVEFLTIEGKRDKASYGDLLSRFEAIAVDRGRLSNLVDRIEGAVEVIGERASAGKQRDQYLAGRRDEADLCEQEVRAALEGGE